MSICGSAQHFYDQYPHTVWGPRDGLRETRQEVRMAENKNLLFSLERSITIMKTEEAHLKQSVVLDSAHYKVGCWDSKRRHTDTMHL